jgi:hypothetical protein
MVALFDFHTNPLRTCKLKSYDGRDEDHIVTLIVCITSLSMIAVVAVCLTVAGRLAMFLHSRHQASYLNSRDPS